jgi:WD40 repeat protein
MLSKLVLNISISLLGVTVVAQNVILKSNKPIRAFQFKTDTIYYSNNDHLIIAKNNEKINTIYLGGYLLDFKLIDSKIHSLSNKYKLGQGTLRIFDLIEDKYSLVYKIEENSPMLSYELLPLPNDSLAVAVSFNNGNLNWYYSSGSLVNQIGKFAKIRQIKKFNEHLFFCTDNGELFKTDGNSTNLIFKTNSKLMKFIVSEEMIFTIDDLGILTKYNIANKTQNHVKISSEILMDFISLNENILVLGDWSGTLFIYDILNDEIISKKEGHNKMILKLQKRNNHEFLSSSQDGTIKNWNIMDL